MKKVRELEDCEHYPLCQHLQRRACDMPSVLLLTAMEIEAESVCCECHDFEQKETSRMT